MTEIKKAEHPYISALIHTLDGSLIAIDETGGYYLCKWDVEKLDFLPVVPGSFDTRKEAILAVVDMALESIDLGDRTREENLRMLAEKSKA